MIFNIGIVFCKIWKGYFRFLLGLLWNIIDKKEYDERSYYVIVRKEWIYVIKCKYLMISLGGNRMILL